MTVSVCIPYYNNVSTIRGTLASVRGQSHPADEIVVVNDGSQENEVHQLGERVVSLAKNSGRGAARALGMASTTGEFVVFVDANKVVRPDFIARALEWFDQDRLGAVFGCITQRTAKGAVERWRGRHLFRENEIMTPLYDGTFVTGGCCILRSAAEAAGGFDPEMPDGDDENFGIRLNRANYHFLCDPALNCINISKNTLGDVLERFARWNAPKPPVPPTLVEYLRQINYSLKVMAREDLKRRDPGAALISLLSPHYQFWRMR